jgi:hypothetical protein
MAIEALSRWQMIRSVILEKKSGALIAQLGRNFLYWIVREGNLLCVSSTLPDCSFTQFLLAKKASEKERILRAQTLINERRSLGSILLNQGIVSEEELQQLLREHWASLTFQLLQSTTHLFWSSRQTDVKAEFVAVELSLAELIFTADRSAVEIRTAIRFSQIMPSAYRIGNWKLVESGLLRPEQRMLHYLRNAAPLSVILKDPDLDYVTCYKVLFLLWLSGSLVEPRKIGRTPQLESTERKIWRSLSSIPPEWIFPLVIGVIIGVLLSPSAPARVSHPAPHMETLKDSLQKPAWQGELPPER